MKIAAKRIGQAQVFGEAMSRRFRWCKYRGTGYTWRYDAHS